jgi:hypothetical protein
MTGIPVTERLKALRLRSGLSMAQVAEALDYKTASGYQHYEDPSKFTKEHLPLDLTRKLVAIFSGRSADGGPPILASEVWALAGIGESFIPEFVPTSPPPSARRAAVIPIYSAAQGGKGHLIVSFERIDEAAAPEEIARVKNAYGILVLGESMVPAYRPGDIAWVNPHKIPERDTDVVLYHVPPDGREAEAIIKTLIGISGSEWKLRQYQPPLDFTESRADWTVCHRIVGKRNVR